VLRMAKVNKLELYLLLREKAIRSARVSFWSFCKLLAPDFYMDGRDYLKDFCDQLQAFAEDDKQILIINAPPRHGKTRTVVLFVTWLIGRDKSTGIMTGSYNELLSGILSKQARDIINIEKDGIETVYKDVFDINIQFGEASAKKWTVEGGYNTFLATSPGGSATGMGANWLIIDDLIKSSYEANTEHVLEAQHSWYVNTMLSRLEGIRKQILVMTRWSTKDLAGRVIAEAKLNSENITIVSYKALNGDVMLCDDVLPRVEYEKLMKKQDRNIFLANYQQEPIDAEGTLYKNIKTYTELPSKYQVHSITDVADKGKDYLCQIAYVVNDGTAYVLDVIYTQDGAEITESLCAEQTIKYSVQYAKYESNNGGQSYKRNVERIAKERGNRTTRFTSFHQSKNKEARILSNSTNVENNILFPENWSNLYPKFADALMSYQRAGKNMNDDAPDTVTMIAEQLDKPKLMGLSKKKFHIN
jgi:predicted phage terminase large subunit-like protein